MVIKMKQDSLDLKYVEELKNYNEHHKIYDEYKP